MRKLVLYTVFLALGTFSLLQTGPAEAALTQCYSSSGTYQCSANEVCAPDDQVCIPPYDAACTSTNMGIGTGCQDNWNRTTGSVYSNHTGFQRGKVGASDTFDLVLAFQNAGNQAWNSSAVALYSKGSSNWNIGSPQRFTGTIQPGYLGCSNQNCVANFTPGAGQAPGTPGSYTFSWQLYGNSVGYFGPTINFPVDVFEKPNVAVNPNPIGPTQNTATVTVNASPYCSTNINLEPGSGLTNCNPTGGSCPDGDPHRNICTFSWSCTKVNTTGSFTATFSADNNPSCTSPASATQTNYAMASNNSDCWAIAPPQSPVVAGQRYTVSAQMINRGNTTWTSAGNYHLGSQNPQDNLTWGVNRVNLSSEPVPPGGIGTFTFDVTAPSTPGTYPWYWRMVQDGAEWFGGQCYTNVGPVATNPTVQIVSPENNSAFTVGQAVPISALAEDADGLLSKGEILVNGSVISTSNFTGGTSRSFSTSWTPSSTGTYSLTAKAYDSAGLSATSDAISVTINSRPAVATPPAPQIISSANYGCIKTPNRGDELTLTWTNPPGVPAVTAIYTSPWPNFYPYQWYSAAYGTTNYAPSPFGWRCQLSSYGWCTWTWSPLEIIPNSNYYFRLYNGNSYDNYKYAWGPTVKYTTPGACTSPSIESPGIDVSHSSSNVSFGGKARFSGRQIAESGSNWLNGQVFSMKAHPGSAGNTTYYLGIYNSNYSYISSYSNFVSTMQNRSSSDPRSSILLAYGNWGEWYVFDGVTYQWVDLSRYSTRGYRICGKNSQRQKDCSPSLEYYTVYPGNLNTSSTLPYTWTVYFNSPLTTQAMYTASYVTDSNLYNVFQADTTPNSPGQ